jgi:hypothetical protein
VSADRRAAGTPGTPGAAGTAGTPGAARRTGALVASVRYGTARLEPDRERPGGWTLLVDGVPQSYVDLTDPTYLRFEYVRRLAAVVDATGPPGAPLNVLHLGGGGLTLARYVAATRPGSTQRVVEHDPALTDLVRRALPLPRRATVRVRAADARAAVEATGDARYDLVLADVYHQARMPRAVASAEFAAHVARVLRPEGRYAVNVADAPPLAFSRAFAATLRTAFRAVCLVADTGLLGGAHSGNAVLVATSRPDGLPVRRLATAGGRFPGRVLQGASLDRFIAGAPPMTDATARDSPAPTP